MGYILSHFSMIPGKINVLFVMLRSFQGKGIYVPFNAHFCRMNGLAVGWLHFRTAYLCSEEEHCMVLIHQAMF